MKFLGGSCTSTQPLTVMEIALAVDDADLPPPSLVAEVDAVGVDGRRSESIDAAGGSGWGEEQTDLDASDEDSGTAGDLGVGVRARP